MTMSVKITRRAFLKAAGGVTLTGALAACGAPAATTAPKTDAVPAADKPAEAAPTAAPAAAAPVTISFMGWGAPEEDEGVKAAIKQFESEQSAVKVQWLHTPEQYGEKFLASVAGTPPDTAFVGSDVFRTYARDGVLLDISSAAQGRPAVEPEGLFHPAAGRRPLHCRWGSGTASVRAGLPRICTTTPIASKEAGVELPEQRSSQGLGLGHLHHECQAVDRGQERQERNRKRLSTPTTSTSLA